MKLSVANWPPPMKKRSNLKSEINENALGRIFPFIHACLCTSNWHKKPQKKVKLSYFYVLGPQSILCMGFLAPRTKQFSLSNGRNS